MGAADQGEWMMSQTAVRKREAQPKIASLSTRARQRAFLAAFVTTGTVVHGARAARVSRAVVYHWRHTDSDFNARFQEAVEDAADALEMEARRRAVDGWQEPVYYRGRVVGTVTKYDDRLLAMLLRARRPEVYGNRVEVKSQAAPTRRLIDPTTSTDAELMARIKAAQEVLFGGQ
jgi:hypothetical protein